MKHPSTRAVHAYWEEQRGTRAAPARTDIDPAAIRGALGDTFMLAADFVDQLRFRLAGTRICALFARELKGEAFLSPWCETSRPSIENLLTILGNENVGVVAGLAGHTADGERTELELLLLPLAHGGHGHTRTRVLGVLAPIAPPYWLGAKPMTELTLGTLRHIGAEPVAGSGRHIADPVLRHPVRQVRHGFTVYSGGRESPEPRRDRLTQR